MKKSSFLYLSIIALLTVVICLQTSNGSGYSYRYILNNKIRTYFFDQKNNDTLYDLTNLEEFNLKFDKKWGKKIDSLKPLIEKTDFKKYRKLNKYFPGKLTIKDKSFNVSVKLHGKAPDGHIDDKHISLKIKFKDSNNPFHSKYIKLIIGKRINRSFDNMKILSDFYSLISTAGKWYNVKVNGNGSYPYLVQIPMGTDYISQHLKQKDFVDFADAPYYITNLENDGNLDQKLDYKIPKHKRHEIQNLLDSLRKDIKDGNSKSIFYFFDETYITNFTACNLTGAFLGHGFNHENFYMLFNSKNKKFYPMITRDNFISPIDCGRNEFDQLTVWEHFYKGSYKKTDNSFLKYLYKSNYLRELALEVVKKQDIDKLEKISKQKSTFERISSDISNIESYFLNEEEHFYKRLSWKIYNSSLIVHNIKHLKNRIANKTYSTHLYQSQDSIKILLASHSISPLKIKNLFIHVNENHLDSISFTFPNQTGVTLDTIILPTSSTIDLAPILEGLHLIDLTDKIEVMYSFTIKFHPKKNHPTNPLYLPEKTEIIISTLISEEILKEYIDQNHIIAF